MSDQPKTAMQAAMELAAAKKKARSDYAQQELQAESQSSSSASSSAKAEPSHFPVTPQKERTMTSTQTQTSPETKTLATKAKEAVTGSTAKTIAGYGLFLVSCVGLGVIGTRAYDKYSAGKAEAK